MKCKCRPGEPTMIGFFVLAWLLAVVVILIKMCAGPSDPGYSGKAARALNRCTSLMMVCT
jgi:predicted membrane channel-forming protein YqfA (hemolysin III family)